MCAVELDPQIICVFSLILLFPPNVISNTVYKCPNLEWFKDARDSSKSSEEDSSNFINIPGSLMSNFEETQFRLEEVDTSFSSFCDKNYEVIKISLIGSDTVNINLSTVPPPAQPLNTQSYFTTTSSPEETESRLSQRDTAATTPAANKLYGAFPKSTNSSYHESFMNSQKNITTIFDTDGEEQEQLCERKLSREQIQFTPDGVLFYSKEYFRPSEYCIQEVNDIEKWIMIRKCNVDCNNLDTPCIPLCCHLHEYIDLAAQCCQATLGSKPMFQPVIYDEANRKLSLESSGRNGSAVDNDDHVPTTTAIVRPHYVFSKYHECSESAPHFFFNENGDSTLNTRIHIQRSGKLAYVADDRKWHFLENYCVAGIVNEESYMEDITGMTAIIQYCLEESVSTELPLWPKYLLIGAFTFSSIFLLVTVVVYVLLWDKQNIHGWTIMSFVTSEFFLFTFLALSYSLSFISADVVSRTPYCIGSAILAHFFFLSTFSWLTVINLDLWWTFKSLTPLSERSKGRKRFCLYMIFAWGLPIIVISTGLILQSIYTANSSNVVVPDYGNRLCFLAHPAQGIYLYYIIGTLLVINLILISFTFLTIYQFKKSTRVASSSSSNNNKEQSFRLFIKLVIVMGFTWIFEVVIWLETDGEGYLWIGLIVDVLNISQAIATFAIFVCKRKIINQVEQKHPSLKVITRPILKLMGQRPSSLMASTTSGKATRSTVACTSSVVRGSRNKSLKVSIGVEMNTIAAAGDSKQ